MLEREVRTTRVNTIDPPTGFEVALNIAQDVAVGRGLEPQTSEALAKFATITYRINEVKRDFDSLKSFKFTNPRIGYAVGFNERHVLMRHKISQEDAPEFIRIHKTMALNLYDTYLRSDENTRLAAKEVKSYVKGLLEKREV